MHCYTTWIGGGVGNGNGRTLDLVIGKTLVGDDDDEVKYWDYTILLLTDLISKQKYSHSRSQVEVTSCSTIFMN